MPILDLTSSKNRRSNFHASGAQTERSERKALHEHKLPYRPAAGKLKHDLYNTILDLGDFSDFQETRSMAAPAISALASQLQVSMESTLITTNRNCTSAGVLRSALELLDDLKYTVFAIERTFRNALG